MNDHTYTAEDFKNARFAEHSDGTYGARTHPHKSMWSIYDKKRQMVNSYTDKDMARFSFRPVHESAPLTLDTLREAWENAEAPTDDNPIREGDTVIWSGGRGYTMAVANISGWPHNVRILHRAPQPEPWQALADVLGGWLESPTELAKYLHERGVRVAGGDDA